MRVTALAVEGDQGQIKGMLGKLLKKALTAFGRRKPQPSSQSAAPGEDDFVARHGLSCGEAEDPISKEARFEAERQKNFRRGPRR